ncbi:alpha/beta fold hydrolase [Rhodococcus sp. HNM0563]|uniref:alpha/beta fold hydrolase n=1 Tax=Rhodococcus sp. HNM0563 TaxID=2716339 RepID=UPI00146F7BFC|nr:alpha/beta fold hydrolase [Rhodococcus sp. HNM0563]NLU61526.1 alpha/beta fold hydrolase [Rhodococcus sp. HNM0563]
MTDVVEAEAPSSTPDVQLAPLGPESVAWSVFGDLTFVLGASHRLLIDVAHPVVAAGVREFSVFETDPYGRAQRTLDMIMGVVYGRESALATARKLRERHVDIKGKNPDGSRWSSLNPEPFHWVHASLVHGVYVQQKLLGRGWNPGEVEKFYLEMRQVGKLYGIRDKDMPAEWADFLVWFDEMTRTRLSRSDITDRVLAVAGSPQAPPIQVPGLAFLWNLTVRPVAGAILTSVTAGLLTPELRELLGLEWTPRRQRMFDALAALSRATVPRLPRLVRLVPQARRAIEQTRPNAKLRSHTVLDVHSADGTRLHAEVHGPDGAPTIVLSHGILCSTEFWHNQIRELSKEFRVVAFDHRGHGRSDAPRAGAYTMDHLADDLHAVLDATIPRGTTAVVAGHSMGGIAVMAWAQRYPDDIAERVSSVALVNTTPGEILDNVQFLRGPEFLVSTRRRLAQTAVPLARLPLPKRLPLRRQLVSRVAVGTSADRSVGVEVDRIIGATPARGRGGYGAMLVGLLSTVDPAALTAPTVVIAGRNDRIAPPSRSRWIADRLPDLIELRTFDTGHCGPLECPGEVSATLRELASNNRTAR